MKKLVSLLLIVSMCMIVLTSSPVVGIEIRGKPSQNTVAITNPAGGSIVSDTVMITCDQVADISIDGTVVATGTSYSWDTTAYADGDHVIKAYVSRKNKQEITVTVDNGGTPPPPPPPDGDGVVNKYAVVVGVSDYTSPDVGDLSFCDEDADDWEAYLIGKGYSVTKLIDAQATERNVAAAIADMVAVADADDKVVFTTSGHGTKYGNGPNKISLLLYSDCYISESTGDGFVGGVVPQDELASWFAPCVAEVFIQVDHCNSGYLGVAVEGLNGYMTTTCGIDGYGYDVPSFENGAWTYYFLELGLVGNGFTTAEDAFAWASANYPYGGRDTPCEFDYNIGVFAF